MNVIDINKDSEEFIIVNNKNFLRATKFHNNFDQQD